MEIELVPCLVGLHAWVRRHPPDERCEGPDREVCRRCGEESGSLDVSRASRTTWAAAKGWLDHPRYPSAHVRSRSAVTGVVLDDHPATAPADPGPGSSEGAAAERRWTPPRPTAADLARQVRDVVVDLPLFLVTPLLRPWHRRWGATPAEVAAPMPGDDLFPRAHLRCTRALTIAAAPEEVWPWLVQVGCLRAGWYSDDLLDDLARPSARTIVPELQDLAVGQWIPMAPRPSAASSFVVDSFAEPRWMLWRTPSSTWAWRLVPQADGRTRLVTRLHVVYDWRRIGTVVWLPLMEFGDFPMMRRMLRGIRDRAEAEHRRRTPPPARPRQLALIRTVHTGAWFVIEFCVGYLLWSGATGRSDRRAAVAAAVVAGECMVFAADGFRCPLTGLAEEAGAASGSVTDIYLPQWFARDLPAVHLPLLALISWLHLRARRGTGRTPEWPLRGRGPLGRR